MSKKRILVVEDDWGIQTLTKFCLEMDDSWEVDIAVNGKEGLFKAINLNPDVILLDVVLPDISGIKVIDSLSSNFYTAQIPIILFTANRIDMEIIGHQYNNVIGIIDKPYDSLTLSADILHFLNQPELVSN